MSPEPTLATAEFLLGSDWRQSNLRREGMQYKQIDAMQITHRAQS